MNSTMTQSEKRSVLPGQERPAQEREQRYLVPPVNITESKDGYVLEAEMPGVNKAGLEVLLEGTELTLIGHRTTSQPNAQLLYRESTPASFRRVFVLDPSIDSERIEAKMESGVLRLSLPKAEQLKPRKITITE